MPAYLTLTLFMGLVWLILFIIRKESRKKILIMSLAVLVFAFFDYLSVPGYWHPKNISSTSIGLEDFLFGFFFGGVASSLYKNNQPIFRKVNLKNVLCLSPVLIVSMGLYFLVGLNIMLCLPIGLFVGCIMILLMRPNLKRRILYSGLYFGLLYTAVLAIWLMIFPSAQKWWNLDIYGGGTVLKVPLGEVLFGFTFGGFWGSLYEFIFSRRAK